MRTLFSALASMRSEESARDGSALFTTPTQTLRVLTWHTHGKLSYTAPMLHVHLTSEHVLHIWRIFLSFCTERCAVSLACVCWSIEHASASRWTLHELREHYFRGELSRWDRHASPISQRLCGRLDLGVLRRIRATKPVHVHACACGASSTSTVHTRMCTRWVWPAFAHEIGGPRSSRGHRA